MKPVCQLLIFSLMFSVSLISHGEEKLRTEDDTSSVKKIEVNKIFNLSLGSSSEDDVKMVAKNYKLVEYGEYVTKDGKSVYVNPTEISGYPDLKFAKFSLNDEFFVGGFLNNILFQLTLTEGDHYDQEIKDGKLILSIKSNFNSKYKKLKTIKTEDDWGFLLWKYVDNYWISSDGSVEVTIREMRKTTKNEFNCMKRVKMYQEIGMRSAQLEFDCKNFTDNIPRYKLTYKSQKLNSEAFSIAQKIQKDKLNDKNDMIKNRINKF